MCVNNSLNNLLLFKISLTHSLKSSLAGQQMTLELAFDEIYQIYSNPYIYRLSDYKNNFLLIRMNLYKT